jgi:hypothetical protein
MTTESRETVSLIGSDKVQGTAVYGADGERIGSIERVMIEKISGKVSVAENHPRCKVRRRNGGSQIASSSRCRLTPSVTRIRR